MAWVRRRSALSGQCPINFPKDEPKSMDGDIRIFSMECEGREHEHVAHCLLLLLLLLLLTRLCALCDGMGQVAGRSALACA
jgi:hypothetical protein